MELNRSEQENNFLSTPIGDLAVTEVFKLRSKLMGFSTISQILDTDMKLITQKEDYSERWYFELVSLLDRNKLLHLI
ncbi:hypothetical protein D3C87_1004400 [compost metagenome]